MPMAIFHVIDHGQPRRVQIFIKNSTKMVKESLMTINFLTKQPLAPNSSDQFLDMPLLNLGPKSQNLFLKY